MRWTVRLLLLFGFLLGLTPAFSEETKGIGKGAPKSIVETRQENSNPAGVTTETVAPTSSRLIGELQIRPSWGHTANEIHTENIASIGYQFNPNFQLEYTQYFNTNLFGTNGKLASEPGLVTDLGFVRANFRKIWQSANKDTHLDFDARMYMPTQPGARGNGFVVASRNIFSLTHMVNSKLALIVQEIPILYAYSQPGDKAGLKANPVFENRLYLIASYDITPKLNFSFPLMLWGTLHRNFGNNLRSNGMEFFAGIWPELLYQVAPTTWLGLSYYSGNLVKADLSDLNFFGKDGGLTQGIAQFVFRQTL